MEFVQNQSNDRVQEIRSRVVAERALIADLDGRIKDSYLKRQLQFALCTLDDVENFFLGKALQEPRTLAAESAWVGYAEQVFQIAVQQRKVVDELVARFGPSLISI